MTSFSILIAAVAVAAGQAASPVKPSPSPATLTFISENRVLVGTVYGLDAIDTQPRLLGQRLSATVAAGRRTVWYSCPNAPEMAGGSRITFNFESWHRYELVCQTGKEAVIRQADEC